MPDHIKCVDPRGITIVCFERIWHRKITKKHAEFLGQEHLVKLTIEQPRFGLIFKDKDFSDRDIYYGLFQPEEFLIKVVVRISDSGTTGEVISVHRSSNFKPGEKLIWPQ